jgi:hypothetical protein
MNKKLPQQLRFAILKRDKYTCRYCGRSSPKVKLNVDHIVPFAKGGTNEHSNLVTSCADCNNGKADSLAFEDEPLPKRRVYEPKTFADPLDQLDYEISWRFEWDRLTFDERASLSGFMAKLPAETILYCADSSASKLLPTRRDLWRYFCGACWKRIQWTVESQDKAQQEEQQPPEREYLPNDTVFLTFAETLDLERLPADRVNAASSIVERLYPVIHDLLKGDDYGVAVDAMHLMAAKLLFDGFSRDADIDQLEKMNQYPIAEIVAGSSAEAGLAMFDNLDACIN